MSTHHFLEEFGWEEFGCYRSCTCVFDFDVFSVFIFFHLFSVLLFYDFVRFLFFTSKYLYMI